MVRLTDRPDITLDVYRGRKTTMQQQQLCCLQIQLHSFFLAFEVTSSPEKRKKQNKKKKKENTKIIACQLFKRVSCHTQLESQSV